MTEQAPDNKQNNEALHNNDSNSEEEEEDPHELSEKGKRMAASIAEYLLMHYFFPEIKDRRKQAILKILSPMRRVSLSQRVTTFEPFQSNSTLGFLVGFLCWGQTVSGEARRVNRCVGILK